MALYIKGMGNISPQQTWGDSALLSDVKISTGEKFSAIEPDYTPFIDPKLIRRMSRIIKMGVASGSMALRQANVQVPDSIITATAYGCLEDTGTFLTKMVENKEQALNPTPFIQSTHNTIGSQIALMLQCQGYNQTYTHGAFSFENALLDALVQTEENPSQNILIGGIDEITPVSHNIQRRFGIFKNGKVNGEGSAFFVVSGDPNNNDIAKIERVATVYKPEGAELADALTNFIRENETDFDFVLTGDPTDVANELQSHFPNVPTGSYKHLCGEYPVSTSFACWLSAQIVNGNHHVLKAVLNNNHSVAPFNMPTPQHFTTPSNILIFNSYFGTHYSLIHIKSC